ncbi:hypothetical protein [Streptomyces sp. NPDC047028]|uniref:hypothetical protein n=1 Tax=Streptomyces sp. NPDC047028 TaxID=3155793 RepID=UPI0033C7A5FE
MTKGILKKIGRRGATAAATVALAATGIGLSAGNANAVGWYYLNNHPTGHGVGVYAQPHTSSAKVAGDLESYSWSGDAVNMVCWTTGDYAGNGDVWYRVVQVYSASYGYWPSSGTSVAYVYAGYADGNWNFHEKTIPQC